MLRRFRVYLQARQGGPDMEPLPKPMYVDALNTEELYVLLKGAGYGRGNILSTTAICSVHPGTMLPDGVIPRG